MARRRPAAAAALIAMICCMTVLCAGGETPARAAGFTAEYRAFLAARGPGGPAVTRYAPGGYRFTLENGRLSVIGTEKAEIWRSKDEWYVDSFEIGDINRDGISDFAFVLWKSYSFGTAKPARMTNDDASVRCHLFVYSVHDDRVKALWCSSNLPRPIYAFELRADGERTPVLSGARIVTREGTYAEDYGETASVERAYAWNGHGFSPERPR
jgi:hypothetical protein